MFVFPLKPANYDTVGLDIPEDAENVMWPPQAVVDRINRIRLYYDLFMGDWSLASPNEYFIVQNNYFQTVPMGIADLLTSEPPVTPDEELNDTVLDVAYEAVIDTIRYGAPLIWTNPEGGIEALDPRFWVPTVNGWVYGVPTTNAENGKVDSIHIVGQTGDTFYEEIREYNGTTSGGTIRQGP